MASKSVETKKPFTLVAVSSKSDYIDKKTEMREPEPMAKAPSALSIYQPLKLVVPEYKNEVSKTAPFIPETNEDNEMGFIKSIKKAYSAFTAAPRAVASVATGQKISLVNSKPIKENFVTASKGTAIAASGAKVAGGAATQARDLSQGRIPVSSLVKNEMIGLQKISPGSPQGFRNKFDNMGKPILNSVSDKLKSLTTGTKTAVQNATSNLSGGVSFGKNQWNALIPIVLGVGVVLFFLFSFSKGSLFGRKKRR